MPPARTLLRSSASRASPRAWATHISRICDMRLLPPRPGRGVGRRCRDARAQGLCEGRQPRCLPVQAESRVTRAPGLVVVALLALAATACGGNTDTGTTGGSGGSGAAGGSGGSGASGGSGGTSSTSCPPAQPASGQSCSSADLRCTYGDTVRPECRNDWVCNGGKWTTTKSVCPHYTNCPASPPTVGTVCSTEAQVCDYANGTLCLCSSCSAGPCGAPPPHWQCAPPPTTAGCPALVPNDGSACGAPEGTKCQYGNPCGPSGAIVSCKGGAWTWQTNIPCPA